MGWASGIQAGTALADRALNVYRQAKQQQEFERIQGATPEMIQGALTPEQQAEIDQAAQRGYEVTPQRNTQGIITGYGYAGPADNPEAGGFVSPAPGGTRFLGQTIQGELTPDRMQGLRYRAMADVVAAQDPARAMQMRSEAMRMEREAEERPLRQRALETQVKVGESQLRGLGRAEEKEIGFNTAFDTINSTKYETPAEKDAAVLAAVSQFKGPEAAAQLQANYSTNERNTILTQGAKFDQTIKQARLKGPAAALKAIDDLNDSFKLEIDGFKVTQVNNDGTRVPFLQAKNAEEFALSVDSRIKEGGAFELAKFRQDEQTKAALIGYYNALAKKAASEGGSAANQLSGVQVGYSRDEKGNPIQVMSALRFNKRSGELESVQVPLERNVVPASALDPEKITKAAELIVGTPVDPTNKKGPQHTFQTARQAVTDQIFNQYLGTGGAAADLDPKGLAAKILAGQQPSTATPAQRPARPPAAVGIDPNRPQAAINPVTGLPRETPVGAPNLVAAVGQGLDAGQARYKAYLESKIANRQPLTADEKIRAQRLGLQ
jgi:hypothetical protein